MSIARCLAALTVALVVATNASAVVLFSDSFTTAASSANYTTVTVGETSVTVPYDYSSIGIPPAPRTTDASTQGIKLEVNFSSGAISAVTLHTNESFSGAYSVKFDAWLNANGPFNASGAPAGVGSTQFLTAGVGGDGTSVNSGNSVAQTGSGGWTAVSGDVGAARDFRMHKTAAEQLSPTGQFNAGTGPSTGVGNPHDNSNAYYAQFEPVDLAALPVQGANNVPNPGSHANQTGITQAGIFGFRWHTVTLDVDPTGGTGGTTSMRWTIDDLVIGTLDAGNNGSFNSDGRVTLGYWDPFTSVSDNPAVTFALIDNLEVSTLAAAINADFNDNDVIDAADYVVWRNNFPTATGATRDTGDSDGDGDVDADDYANWKATFGNPAPGGGSAGDTNGVTSANVPEPSSLAIAVLSLGTLLIPWRRLAFVPAAHPARAGNSSPCAKF